MPHEIGTGTFGGKISQSFSEFDELKQENIAMRQEMHLLKDQLKTVIGTLGTFRQQVAEQFSRFDQQILDLN